MRLTFQVNGTDADQESTFRVQEDDYYYDETSFADYGYALLDSVTIQGRTSLTPPMPTPPQATPFPTEDMVLPTMATPLDHTPSTITQELSDTLDKTVYKVPYPKLKQCQMISPMIEASTSYSCGVV
jgi:hypothetical protein